MKLSDIKGERTLEVIADLIEPIARIAEDENAKRLFKREKVPEGMTSTEFFGQRMRKLAPDLLRYHKDDIICILSTIDGKTPEDYTKSLNLASLLKDLIELLNDDTFLGFLSSSQSETAGAQPTSRLEIIEGRAE